MRISKSVRVLTTLSVLSGIAATTVESHAGSAYPTSVAEMDGFLRSQFPNKLTDSQRDQALAFHTSQAILGFMLMTLPSVAKNQKDAALRAEQEAVTKLIDEELPKIHTEMAVHEAQSAALERQITNARLINPRDGYQSLMKAMIAQKEELNLVITFEKLKYSAVDEMASQGHSIDRTKQLGKKAQEVMESINRAQSEFTELSRDLHYIQTTGKLPSSMVQLSRGEISALVRENKAALKALKNAQARQDAIVKRAEKVTAKITGRASVSSRIVRGGFRLVLVGSGTVVAVNALTSSYIAYNLGRDTGSGLAVVKHFANSTYPDAIKDSVIDLSNDIYFEQIEPAAQKATEAGKAAVEKAGDLL